uniref:CHCH domain-containing protein n=1 Tax=Heterorhabditis bacteriophora TaxID=37862 RepID=A0A1I7XQG0_HETBA
MVRRRAASPKPSAPVRAAASPRPAAPVAAAPMPTPRPAAAPMTAPSSMPTAPSPQGPGLFAQMAATAGGVAIGSAVGHTVGHMITGSGGGSSQDTSPAPVATNTPQQQSFSQPCEFEWKQFIECTQNQSDVSLCNGFNDAFKQCKSRYV